MTSPAHLKRVSACRPTNPSVCAQCLLAYDCQAKANDRMTVAWPLVMLFLFGVAAILSLAF
jgi:hypothetical protein